MKWSSIKNLMIGFLIFMNIFMLAIIITTSIKKSYIPQNVIDSSLSVLRKSGFEISEDIFPDKYYTKPSYKAQFYSASDLSDLFFKKQIPFRTVGESLIGIEEYASLTVSDNYFLYDSGEVAIDKVSMKELQQALEEIGFDMTGAVYDKKTGHFYKMFDNANLFNMYLEAKLDKNGNVCFVKAQWPKSLTKAENKTISFIESSAKLKELFPDGGTIKNVELGYSLHALGGDNFIFSPAWRVNVNGEPKIIE